MEKTGGEPDVVAHDSMISRVAVFRWIAIPLIFAGGLSCAAWAYLWAAVACLHFGHWANPCSDWWSATHDLVAVAAFVACTLAFSVAGPYLLAPSHKRVVALVAPFAILGFIIAESNWWLAFTFVVAAALTMGIVFGVTWRRDHAA